MLLNLTLLSQIEHRTELKSWIQMCSNFGYEGVYSKCESEYCGFDLHSHTNSISQIHLFLYFTVLCSHLTRLNTCQICVPMPWLQLPQTVYEKHNLTILHKVHWDRISMHWFFFLSFPLFLDNFVVFLSYFQGLWILALGQEEKCVRNPSEVYYFHIPFPFACFPCRVCNWCPLPRNQIIAPPLHAFYFPIWWERCMFFLPIGMSGRARDCGLLH